MQDPCDALDTLFCEVCRGFGPMWAKVVAEEVAA